LRWIPLADRAHRCRRAINRVDPWVSPRAMTVTGVSRSTRLAPAAGRDDEEQRPRTAPHCWSWLMRHHRGVDPSPRSLTPVKRASRPTSGRVPEAL
jgi:hypothetical protein